MKSVLKIIKRDFTKSNRFFVIGSMAYLRNTIFLQKEMKLFVGKLIDVKCFILKFSVTQLVIRSLLCWLFSYEKKLVIEAQICKVVEVDQEIVANCSRYPASNFVLPQTLQENINVLDISHNTFSRSLSKTDFQRYKDTLTSLDMSFLSPWNIHSALFDMEIFVSLPKLEYLKITNCHYLKNPQFPPSLKILHMQMCGAKDWKFSNLDSLEMIFAANNQFVSFPSFHGSAPLKHVDFGRNPLQLVSLQLETLALYCQLHYVRLNPQSASEGDTEASFCHCKLIEWWLQSTNVEFEQLNCRPPILVPSCKLEASEEAHNLREECLSNVNTSPVDALKRKWLIFVIVIIIILIFGLSIPLVVLGRKRFGVQSKKRRKKWKKKLLKKIKKVGDLEIEEEYYEEYEEEVLEEEPIKEVTTSAPVDEESMKEEENTDEETKEEESIEE